MPSVDDGSKDWEESKKMLRIAYDEGIRNIILTPHYHTRYWQTAPDELKEKLSELQRLAHDIDEDFQIYPGNELYYEHDAKELLHNGIIQTLAGSSYVLVEFSPAQDFQYIKNSLYDLQMGGYSPILAHIERYQCLEKNLQYVVQLENMGIYLQVNASSVVGGNGLSTKRFVKKVLERNLIHFIGTDAHGANIRPPHIKKCAQYIQKKYGDERLELLLYHHPMRIIQNKSMSIPLLNI